MSSARDEARAIEWLGGYKHPGVPALAAEFADVRLEGHIAGRDSITELVVLKADHDAAIGGTRILVGRLKAELAQAQAEVVRLRDALMAVAQPGCEGFDYELGKSLLPCACLPCVAGSALSAPSSTAALRAVCERVAKKAWTIGAEYGCEDASTVANTPNGELVPSDMWARQLVDSVLGERAK